MRVSAECALHAFGQEPCNEHSEVSSGGCLTVTAFLSLVAGVVFVHEADPLVITDQNHGCVVCSCLCFYFG